MFRASDMAVPKYLAGFEKFLAISFIDVLIAKCFKSFIDTTYKMKTRLFSQVGSSCCGKLWVWNLLASYIVAL